MQEITGNIWDYHETGFVVISTNVGWKSDGTNPMGAGLAKQAAERFPDLPRLYGAWCKTHGSLLMPVPEQRLIMFPTKPLNNSRPHLSWQNRAHMQLILKSMQSLAAYMAWTGTRKVYIPRVGCGHGGLEWKDVCFWLSSVHVGKGEVVVVHNE